MYMFSWQNALSLSFGLLQVASAAPQASRPTVTVASGAVIGTTTALPSATVSVNKYLGIPFAASPPLRFAPPTDPQKWTTPIDASSFKPACIQQFNDPASERNFTMQVFNNPAPVESEDCLYLNVFTPSTPAPAGGRTVMFWIFGGDLQFGNAGQPFYDGSSFAANQDVVLVTTNYRTNVFGFSNSPDIPVGQQNAGYLDQRKALAWVQTNIHVFGGDPDKVTIFGESAGAYSVKQLLANPPSPRPYRAAILESEAAAFVGSGLTSWEALVTALGCTASVPQINCVRKASATQIKSIIETNSLDFAPVNDGVTQSNDVRPAIISKTFANVPFFLGTNSQEGRVFATAAGLGSPDASVQAFLNATFPNQPALQAAILAAYPSDIANDPYYLISAIITDLEFLCPASALGNLAALNGYQVWRYYFDATFPNTQTFPQAGVYHSSEIPEVFGTYAAAGSPITAQEIGLSKTMQTAWANFAKSPSGGPGWPGLGTNLGVELGDLGSSGASTEKTIPLATVDGICSVYAPVIAAEGL